MQLTKRPPSDLIGELFVLGEHLRAVARELSTNSNDAAASSPAGSVIAFPTPSNDTLRTGDGGLRQKSASRPPLPDPRLIRQIIRDRRHRARFFNGELFGDPAWDILLDLTVARAEHTRVSVTSLCIASGVPPTTALRWIGQMTDDGLLKRVDDDSDRRRAFITLTDQAADAMARYFDEVLESGALHRQA